VAGPLVRVAPLSCVVIGSATTSFGGVRRRALTLHSPGTANQRRDFDSPSGLPSVDPFMGQAKSSVNQLGRSPRARLQPGAVTCRPPDMAFIYLCQTSVIVFFALMPHGTYGNGPIVVHFEQHHIS